MKAPWCHWCGGRKAATILDGRPSCNECATPIPSPDDEDGPAYIINERDGAKPGGCKHCGCGVLPEWNRVCPECRFIQSRRGGPKTSRAAYARRRRQQLKEAGLCSEDPTHGMPHKGGRCYQCWHSHLSKKRKYYAAKRRAA